MADQRIRDQREPRHFWADNEVVDQYLDKIGAYGFAVYMLLCRYANNDTGQCDPSIETLARKLGVSAPTIKKAINKLKDAGLITVTPRQTEQNGKTVHLTNVYTLLKVKGRCQEGVGNDVTQVGNDVTQVNTKGGQPNYPGVGNDVATNNTDPKKTDPKPEPIKAKRPRNKLFDLVLLRSFTADPRKRQNIELYKGRVNGIIGSLNAAFPKDPNLIKDLRRAYRRHARSVDESGSPLHPCQSKVAVVEMIKRVRRNHTAPPVENPLAGMVML